MTKKELLSRWRIIRTKLDKLGIDSELDLINEKSIVVIVKTSRDQMSELIEWGYEAWADVRACWQSRDDNARYFGIAFKTSKKYGEEAEEEEDD